MGPRSTLADAEACAREGYREPGREYHGETHLDDCLAQLRDVAGLSDRDRDLLRRAVIWHDAIYDPKRFDNEERSAERAEQDLAAAGLDAGDRAEVARLILLTKGHCVDEGDRLGSILVSIDLSILGADPERYDRYAAAIREEYSHVPDEAYRAGRAAVLRHFLEAETIFPDAEFRERLEARARSNLERELRALDSSR